MSNSRTTYHYRDIRECDSSRALLQKMCMDSFSFLGIIGNKAEYILMWVSCSVVLVGKSCSSENPRKKVLGFQSFIGWKVGKRSSSSNPMLSRSAALFFLFIDLSIIFNTPPPNTSLKRLRRITELRKKHLKWVIETDQDLKSFLNTELGNPLFFLMTVFRP